MCVSQVPALWKLDIDAAFRRVPLQPSHKWAAGVAYKLKNEVWVAVHKSMPFGAASSVYAWHRVGHLIREIARSRLHLAVGRYVDDYFGVERAETAEHALGTGVRLIRALLGQTAVADRKCEIGRSLIVLGTLVSARWWPSSRGDSATYCVCRSNLA